MNAKATLTINVERLSLEGKTIGEISTLLNVTRRRVTEIQCSLRAAGVPIPYNNSGTEKVRLWELIQSLQARVDKLEQAQGV